MNRFHHWSKMIVPVIVFVSRSAFSSEAEDARLKEAIDFVVSQPDQARYAAVLDYRKYSGIPRFHVVDTQSRRIVQSFLVAHGKGSDKRNDGYAEMFSDFKGSLASSLGLFRTGVRFESSTPNHGLSVRLIGKSESNRNAYARAIVIHANTYVERAWVERYGRPGRSHGCMAFSAADRDAVVKYLGTDAWIYAFAEQ